jgi:hypothetical protein
MTYTTHVQPQRHQYSTNAAATASATVEEVDSIDSEEEEDDYEAIKEGTRPNLTNTYSQLHLYTFNKVQPNRKQYHSKTAELAAAAIEKYNSEDSEQSNNDNYHADEQESDGGNSNSDTECTSETCESETYFQMDNAAVNSKVKKRRKSNEALKRMYKAQKNSYWIKNELKRKSNKYYKIALLDLNDLDISSIPTGEDHQVR